jgi:hypothetical protein
VTWAGDRRAEVFVKTGSGDILHASTNGSTDDWYPLDKIDGDATCGFTASSLRGNSGHPEVWSPLQKGSIGHAWFEHGVWNTFEDFGGEELTQLSALAWPDGRMEVFARRRDGRILHKFSMLDRSGWSGWQTLGDARFVTGAAPILSDDGRAELFATDAKGIAWHNRSHDSLTAWHGWAPLSGKITSRPIPVRWSDGHLEVFARGGDGYLVHSEFVGKWTAFSRVDSTMEMSGEPSAIMNVASHDVVAGPEVFVRDETGRIVHTVWDGDDFTPLAPLGDRVVTSDPLGFVRSGGRAEVFAVDDGGTLIRSYHAHGSGWSVWAAIGGEELDGCAEAAPKQGADRAGGVLNESGTALSTALHGDDAVNGCALRAVRRDAETGSSCKWVSLAVIAWMARRRRDEARRSDAMGSPRVRRVRGRTLRPRLVPKGTTGAIVGSHCNARHPFAKCGPKASPNAIDATLGRRR